MMGIKRRNPLEICPKAPRLHTVASSFCQDTGHCLAGAVDLQDGDGGGVEVGGGGHGVMGDA